MRQDVQIAQNVQSVNKTAIAMRNAKTARSAETVLAMDAVSQNVN